MSKNTKKWDATGSEGSRLLTLCVNAAKAAGECHGQMWEFIHACDFDFSTFETAEDVATEVVRLLAERRVEVQETDAFEESRRLASVS